MSDLVRDLEESRPDWEAECKRLTEIVTRQRENIVALENACFNLAVALRNKGEM